MVSTRFLHSQPHLELHSLINSLISAADSFSIIVGFLTEAGAHLLNESIRTRPAALQKLVVGATTHAACRGLNLLLEQGVPADRLRIFLGHSRQTNDGFVKYHPMMHSKIYYFEHGSKATAIVGSHNMTSFALEGQNTEASVVIEGDKNETVFQDVRTHISHVDSRTHEYDPSKQDGYAWWFMNLFQGMSAKVLGREDDLEFTRNVVAVAVAEDNQLPVSGEIVFLEVPRAFQVMRALGQPVHLYVLRTMPNSPQDALEQLKDCRRALRGTVIGSNEEVVREGTADWVMRNIQDPVLVKCTGTVKPTRRQDYVQVFVQIGSDLKSRYEYFFDRPRKWQPAYSDNADDQLYATSSMGSTLCVKDSFHNQNLPWDLVIDLQPVGESEERLSFEKSLTPEGGGFIFFSRRRRKISRKQPMAKVAIPEGVSVPVGQSKSVTLESVQVASSIPASVWKALSGWKKEIDITGGKGRSFPFQIALRLERGNLVSDRQAPIAVEIILRALANGFEHPDLSESMIRQLRSFQ